MTEEKTIQKRIVNAASYIDVIRELVGEGQEVSLLITGNSMSPFLVHERDTILIARPPETLRKGDMVFYQRRNGQYVMHRIYRVRQGSGGEAVYYMVGDAQQEIEGPIEQRQIFGFITKVCRKGRWIGKGDFWWEFFEHVWIRAVPFRRMLTAVYGMKDRLLFRNEVSNFDGSLRNKGGNDD